MKFIKENFDDSVKRERYISDKLEKLVKKDGADLSLDESVDTEKVKEILSGRLAKDRKGIRPFSDDEKMPRGFRFKSGTGDHGEVSYLGTDYAYAVVNGKVRVMTDKDAGWNWSETLYNDKLFESAKEEEDVYRVTYKASDKIFSSFMIRAKNKDDAIDKAMEYRKKKYNEDTDIVGAVKMTTDEVEDYKRRGMSLVESAESAIDELKEKISGLGMNDVLVFDVADDKFSELYVKKTDRDGNYYTLWNESEDGEVANLIKYSSLDNAIYWIKHTATSLDPRTLKNKHIVVKESKEDDDKVEKGRLLIISYKDGKMDLGRLHKELLDLFDGDYKKAFDFLSENEYVKLKEDEEVHTEEVEVEEIPAAPQTDDAMGVANMLNALIRDEWEAIDGYNSTIATYRDMGKGDYPEKDDKIDYEALVKILEDIAQEEMNHVGMLQKAMETISPNVSEISSGEDEAKETLNDPESVEVEEKEKD